MRTVGIKTLKNKLSEYIRAAAAGETILVTDRGRVVAEINAPSPRPPATTEEAFIEGLIRRGVMTPAVAPCSGPPPRLEPFMTLEEILRDLDEDRADR